MPRAVRVGMYVPVTRAVVVCYCGRRMIGSEMGNTASVIICNMARDELARLSPRIPRYAVVSPGPVSPALQKNGGSDGLADRVS